MVDPDREYRACLRQVLSRKLERVTYWALQFETDGSDLDTVDFYFGGEVELHFGGTDPIRLTWAENAGWPEHFSLQVRHGSAFLPDTLNPFDASGASVWSGAIGAKLTSVSVFGWDETPHVARLQFERVSVLVGSSYQTRFGGGDDVFVQRDTEAALDDAELLWTYPSNQD